MTGGSHLSSLTPTQTLNTKVFVFFFLIFRLGSNPLQFLQFLHQYFKGKKKAKTNQPEDEAIKYKFSIEESFCNKWTANKYILQTKQRDKNGKT